MLTEGGMQRRGVGKETKTTLLLLTRGQTTMGGWVAIVRQYLLWLLLHLPWQQITVTGTTTITAVTRH